VTDNPSGTPADPVGAFLRVLFSFRGRIGRARYWAGFAAVIIIAFLNLMLLAQANNPTGAGPGVLLALPLFILFLWIHLAVIVKRLRDAGFVTAGIILYALAPIAFLAATAEFIEKLWPLIVIVLVALFTIPGLLPSKPASIPAPAN